MVSTLDLVTVLAGILSHLSTLYISTHQLLVVFRHLPALHLIAASTFQALQAAKALRTPKNSPQRNIPAQAALGVATAFQHTFFIWSFLKMPPAAAVAIHVLADPVSRLAGFSSTGKNPVQASPITWITSILLLLLVDRVAPMNTTGLLLGFGALAVNVACTKFRHMTGGGDGAGQPELISSVIAALVSLGLDFMMGSRLFGEKYYLLKPVIPAVAGGAFFAVYNTMLKNTAMPSINTVAAVAALFVSAMVTGMKERITWFDIVVMLPITFLGVFEIRAYAKTTSVPSNGAATTTLFNAEDGHEMEENATFLNGLPKPSTQSLLSRAPGIQPSQRVFAVAAVVLISYAIGVQLFLIPLPHLWRWDVRPLEYHMLLDQAPNKTLIPHSVAYSRISDPVNTLAAPTWPPKQLEIVISYYNEPLNGVADLIKRAYREQPTWTRKTTVYHKGVGYDSVDQTGEKAHTAAEVERSIKDWITEKALSGLVDTVIASKNVGRDGGTYLKHIVDNYDRLADFTIFMQGHVPFSYEWDERLKLMNERTGFLAFGHYLTVTNGHDNWGNGDFSRIKNIWELTQPTEYPTTTPHLASYHGEFGVSRARILRNPKSVYENLLAVLTAPAGSPIYSEEGHWGWKGVADGPDNPFFGHSLERGYGIMFNCFDPRIEQACWLSEPASAACYCPDDQVLRITTNIPTKSTLW